jgi:hypothetical protein
VQTADNSTAQPAESRRGEVGGAALEDPNS